MPLLASGFCKLNDLRQFSCRIVASTHRRDLINSCEADRCTDSLKLPDDGFWYFAGVKAEPCFKSSPCRRRRIGAFSADFCPQFSQSRAVRADNPQPLDDKGNEIDESSFEFVNG